MASSRPPAHDRPPDLTGLDPSTIEYMHSLWIAEDFDDVFADSPLFRFDQEFLDRLFPRPLRLLDLGCGTGRLLVHFAELGFDVTGVDLSDHMLRVTAEKIAQRGLHARLVKSNICRIPELADGTFDAAISMFSTVGMIRGHQTRVIALREAARLLRPGGMLVFHVHNILHGGLFPEAWMDWARSLSLCWFHGYEFGDKILPTYRSIPNMYVHAFRPAETRRLIQESGLRLLRLAWLNEQRNEELGPVFFRSLRANGFIAVAQKAETEPR